MDKSPKPLPKLGPADVARFWSHVDVGKPTECWPWLKACNRSGYGKFTAAGRTLTAHRVAFLLVHGYDPGSALVCHTCDNPGCCNGMHLFDGTAADNAADCKQKGRLNTASGAQHRSQTRPDSLARGERVPNAKLTAADVEFARATYAAGGVTQSQLAAKFGVAREAMGDALRGKNWAHVPTTADIADIGRANRVKRGDENGFARLRATDVVAIRERYARGGTTHAELAAEYGVSVATVRHAITGRTWEHLPFPLTHRRRG